MPHTLKTDRANLLIVDDDVTVIQVLAKALAGVGSVRYALNGADALRLAESDPPDVILLDAHMPGMSGFEVLEALRRIPGLENAPAYMCSADAMPEDIARAKAAGFTGYWTKPIDIRQITAELTQLAHQKKSPP